MESLECTEEIDRVPAPPLEEFQPPAEEPRPQPKKIKDQSAVNILELLRQPQRYCDRLHELNEQGSQRIRRQLFDEAVRLLVTAEEMINVGKTACRLIDAEVRICVLYNMACAYQGLWTLQKCKKYCQLATEQLVQLLKVVGEAEKERWLKLAQFLLKLRLQHCAILSQLGHHQKALDTSKLGLTLLQQCIALIYSFAEGLQKEQQQSAYNYSEEGAASSKIAFASTANKFVQLLKMLMVNLNEQMDSKTVKKPILYYWKNNPQNNERLLKQQFSHHRIFTKQEQVRSLLGIHNETDWIEQFNIGTIMHMSSVTYRQLKKSPNLLQQLTKRNLYEKVIYCSVVQFTIATEIRFLEDPNKTKEQNSKQKRVSEVKSEAFKNSELYHLKAIEIMCQGISTCSPYLNHLINSYYKHYLHSLGPIEEHENSVLEDNRSSRNVSVQGGELQHQSAESIHHQEYYAQKRQHSQQVESPSQHFRQMSFAADSGAQSPLPHHHSIPSASPTTNNRTFTQPQFTDQSTRDVQVMQSEILQRSATRFQCAPLSKAEEPVIMSESEDEEEELLQPTARSRHRKRKGKLPQGRDPSKSRTKRSQPDVEQLIRHAKSSGRHKKSSKLPPRPETRAASPPTTTYVRSTNSKSNTKLPLNMIKKAFQSDKFGGMTPSSVQLTQNTTTQINVVLKKKK